MQETSSRPSQLAEELLLNDQPLGGLAAYCFDSAVIAFGTTIGNALQETDEVGPPGKKKRRAKYSLEQLLSPDFHLTDPNARPKKSGVGALKAWAMALQGKVRGGVKVVQAKGGDGATGQQS